MKLPSSLYLKNNTAPKWVNYPLKKLEDLTLKDVYLPLNKTGLTPFINRLYSELSDRGIKKFKPHFWFSDEWFTPEGVGGVAIPFYLAHKKLASLEKKYLFDIEGGTPQWFMQLLRHECGHAIDNAYRLRLRKKRQRIFGKSSLKYDDYYIPKPFSRKYVIHLDTWYAQSHPDEDFAETFAVWLKPKSNWRKRYKSWPAIKKLEYMDELMSEIGNQAPLVKNKNKVDCQNELTITLKEHYEKRQDYFGLSDINFYDFQLYKVFTKEKNNLSAEKFLRIHRSEIRRVVAKSVGTYQYVINQILDEVILRCKELELFLMKPEESTKLEFTSTFSILTLEYIREGNHKVAR